MPRTQRANITGPELDRIAADAIRNAESTFRWIGYAINACPKTQETATTREYAAIASHNLAHLIQQLEQLRNVAQS